MDAIDAVLLAIDGNSFSVRGQASTAISQSLKRDLLALCESGSDEIEKAGQLDIIFGQLTASTIGSLLQKEGIKASQVSAIGSHGQTIRHCPDLENPFTLQIGNPSVIAHLTGITTVADFRMADMAAGGQGAPMVPAFHAAAFQNNKVSRAIVNLGGIANVTYLPKNSSQEVHGFDIGPANTLMDRWIDQHKNQAYDINGEWAQTGNIQQNLLDSWLEDPYLKKKPPKSTGREYYNQQWLEEHLPKAESYAPQDIQRTLLEFSARSIADALDGEEVYLCGGGARNRFLVERLTRLLPDCSVACTSELGIDPQLIEPCAFAWLAHRTMQGFSGNIPSVTGASRTKILGGIYPAS